MKLLAIVNRSNTVKRSFDLCAACIGLLTLSPIILAFMVRIKLHDWGPVLYRPLRAGLKGHPFKMMKLRSMVINADKTGVTSTANTDARITPPGQLIRRYKLDELMQLVNVALGQMSLVGPRPNLLRETEHYTNEEHSLLSVKPGITDFSSIVFSDEGAILEGYPDADLAYQQLIRPWKSRLGLFYVQNRSFTMDLGLIFDTCLSIVSRQRALKSVSRRLARAEAPAELVEIALRRTVLAPYPPPGAAHIVGGQPVQKQGL